MTRVAVVTTTKDAREMTCEWARYHTSVGFERAYVFFDNPKDDIIERCSAIKGVTAVLHDDELRRQWADVAREDPWYQKALETVHTHQPRQMLNAAVALRLARRDGIDWLLHVDIDELFCCAQPADVYFRLLSELELGEVRFVNHEGVPEQPETDSVFSTMTLFKLSPEALSPWQMGWFNKNYPDRLSYFVAYTGHKGAGRVAISPRAQVHGFIPRVPQPRLEGLRTGIAGLVARAVLPHKTLDSLTFRDPGIAAPDAAILHYPCGSLSNFVRRYQARINTTSELFGGEKSQKLLYEMGQTFFRFEWAAWEVARNGDPKQLEAFFTKQVMYSPNDVRRLLEGGFMRRIDKPASVLGKLAASG